MKLLILPLIFLVAGCTSPNNINTQDTLLIDVSPQDIFTGGTATATLELSNSQGVDLSKISMSIFDSGALAAEGCSFTVPKVEQGSFASRSCTLRAPAVIEDDTITTNIAANAKFSTTLHGSQSISIITEDEYRIRQAKGELEQSSPIFVHNDGNLQFTVSFSEPMPILYRTAPSKDDINAYMYIDITNVGNGRIESITGTRIEEPDGASIIDKSCLRQTLYIQGKTFPRVACRISAPASINYLSDYTVIINIQYNYEIRSSKQVTVRR